MDEQQQQRQQRQMSLDSGGGGDRFPQWSIQETKEFLMIRGELDQTFMETKRNKLLWEVISTRLKEKGYQRSADQCKCKWKNLVTRYKGCESMEAEAARQQFPLYKEVQGILAARMQRIMWADVEGASKNEEDQEEEEELESNRKKKKKKKSSSHVSEMLDVLMRHQMEMEGRWMEACEARERERRAREMEWRQTMEALDKERLLLETRWMEREDHRKVREEARAHNRDALITALLNNLTNNNHHI